MRIVLLAAVVLLIQTPAPISSIELQPAQLREDFDVLRRAVEEAHGGLTRFASKREIDKTFDEARARLGRPMSSVAFIGILSEALAAVRDGHMRLEYDASTTAALAAARLLPLRVASEDGRIVVTHNDGAADGAIQPGMELLSVNGRPIKAIIAAILPKLSGDGFIETGKRWRMARAFAQNYWLFVEQTDTFRIAARSDGGAGVTATLDGITNAERAKVMQSEAPQPAVSLSFPKGEDVGVLRVRFFDGETFPASIAAAVGTLREKKARAVILDLRGNVGGVDMFGSLLVSQFVTAPFRYFESIKVTTIRPSFATWKPSTFDEVKNGTAPASGGGGFLVLPVLHPGVAEQKPADAPFTGKLVVLIDGGTFSTAADVAAQLRFRTKATFIGEETGGTFEGNTSGLNALIVLPHSGLKLKIQMYGYWNAVRGWQRGRGTMPDLRIVRKTSDLLSGRDAALDRAFTSLAGSR